MVFTLLDSYQKWDRSIIKINKVPHCDEPNTPDNIREAWVGLILPSFGVHYLAGFTEMFELTGFFVKTSDAIRCLRYFGKDDAADYWEKNWREPEMGFKVDEVDVVCGDIYMITSWLHKWETEGKLKDTIFYEGQGI